MKFKEEDKRILIVEDDPRSGKMIQDVLKAHGYRPDLATDGEKGYAMYKANPYPVVISDLEMPNMGGEELIEKLSAGDPPQIIVETCHDESEIIIDVMKNSVLDYMIKPIDLNELLLKVHRAVEMAVLKRAKKASDDEKMIRLENQLNWFKWINEQSKTSSFDKHAREKALIYNLRTSLTQGTGFGQLITLLDFLMDSAKKDGDNYIVPEKTMKMVKENTEAARQIIDAFLEVDNVMTREIEFSRVLFADLYEQIRLMVQEFEPLAEKKGQRIVLSEPRSDFSSVEVDTETGYLLRILRELIVNALKFSPEQSDISVIIGIDKENFRIQVLNPAVSIKGVEGIPLEYENLVFEPFFRVSHSVLEGYGTLDIGIGLNLVRNMVEKLGGEIKVSNITDHSKLEKTGVLVDFDIIFPLKHTEDTEAA